MQGRKLIKTLHTQKQQERVSNQAPINELSCVSYEIGSLSINRDTGSLFSWQNDKPNAFNLIKKEDQINQCENFNLHLTFLKKQQAPQAEVQKPKSGALRNTNKIQSIWKKCEQQEHSRNFSTSQKIQEAKNKWKQRINKNLERENLLSFTEIKLNLNNQVSRKKYSHDFQSRQKAVFDATNLVTPSPATSNIFMNPQIQQSQPHQPFFNQTVPVYFAQSVPQFSISSNKNTLINSISQQNANLPLQRHTQMNIPSCPIQYFKPQPPQQYMMGETNLSIYPQNIMQHLSNDSIINSRQNVCIQPDILTYQMRQNKSKFFFPNNPRTSNPLQFERNLFYIKEAIDQLPLCYNFETIASLKIRDLKQHHKSFAYLVRNMRLIKSKIGEMMQKKYEIDLKNKEIGCQGMQKLLNLKKTYFLQNEANNTLQQNSKTLGIIIKQLKTLQPVTQGYLCKKEFPFFNPDYGVIFLAQYIRQKYRSLYKLYLQSVKVPQSQEKLEVNPLQILQQQIEFLYWIASALGKLQKKIKSLKMVLNSRQKEQLNEVLQNSANNQMNEEWRNLRIFFELGQTLENKLQRDR